MHDNDTIRVDAEIAPAGIDDVQAILVPPEALRAMLKDATETTRKLRALWALHVTGGLTEELLLKQLDSPDGPTGCVSSGGGSARTCVSFVSGR